MADQLRDVRVPVDDGVAARESSRETCFPPRSRAAVVGHPDPEPPRVTRGHAGVDLGLETRGKRSPQRRLVGVAVHREHRRPDRPQIVEEAGGREIAGVQDQIGPPQLPEERLGEPSGPPRKVRVRDDRDEAQAASLAKPAPAQTPSVVIRSGFVCEITVTNVLVRIKRPALGPMSFTVSVRFAEVIANG